MSLLNNHMVLIGLLVFMFLAGAGSMFAIPKTRLAAFVKEMFERSMGEPEVNSRLVFLINGIVTAFGVLLLSVGFLFVKDRTGFPVMVGAIGGGGVGAAIGRYFTKKGDAETTAAAQPQEQK